MNRKRFLTTLLAMGSSSLLKAQSSSISPKQRQAYTYLVHPEPRAMRSRLSRVLSQELSTVFSPAIYRPESKQLENYSEEKFSKLGLGWDSFYTKAQESANFILATLTPKLIRASDDPKSPLEVIVYEGPEAWYSSLMIASKLVQMVEPYLGSHIIVAAPDRYSLYIFPPKTEILSKYTDELFDRNQNSPYAASEEFFSIKSEAIYPVVVGNFTGR